MTADDIDETIINTKIPVFKYGDNVCSKNTGFPGVGKVIAMVQGSVYNAVHLNNISLNWDEKFPNWKNEFIYTVAFENKRKPIRYDEFFKQIDDNIKELYKNEAINKMYDNIAERRVIAYPEQDLELFE